MCFRIQEKNALIQDCLFRLTPGAIQHELRELLTAKRCRPVQHRLCLSGCPNLNNIVLSNRSSHTSRLGIVCTLVLTLSIHTKTRPAGSFGSGRSFRLSVGVEPYERVAASSH